MLYRYYYAILGGFGAIHGPEDGELKCNENDVCDYFLRPFDALHVWTFFLIPLLFAEGVVYLLRCEKSATDKTHVIDEGEKDDCNNEEDVAQHATTEHGTESAETDKPEAHAENTTNFLYLNMFGMLFAIICLGSTVFIYVTSALGVNTFSV
jgi:hypothetical protein